MKTRDGWVSNSSTTSFTCYGLSEGEAERAMEAAREWYNAQRAAKQVALLSLGVVSPVYTLLLPVISREDYAIMVAGADPYDLEWEECGYTRGCVYIESTRDNSIPLEAKDFAEDLMMELSERGKREKA